MNLGLSSLRISLSPLEFNAKVRQEGWLCKLMKNGYHKLTLLKVRYDCKSDRRSGVVCEAFHWISKG